ncbi:MAG: LytTR family transcriptional regulator DNA-binding domain-containing protein [Clostridia bacterium]|nr:LytTR family transcriptional regulator DNA-binding domain-containing protein [Clostridia bacterium]
MKITIITDKTKDEEIIIRVHKRTELIEKIEKLVNETSDGFIGYKENEAMMLDINDVNCFITENNRVFAMTDEKLIIKERLYRIEEKVGDNFIKINQSCIANISKIVKVQATFSGSLSVVFRNGYTDYISRRNLKKVKERLGVKL